MELIHLRRLLDTNVRNMESPRIFQMGMHFRGLHRTYNMLDCRTIYRLMRAIDRKD